MDLGDLLKNIGIGDVIGDMLQLLHLFLIQGIGESISVGVITPGCLKASIS